MSTNGRRPLDRAEIEALDDHKVELCEIPEWGNAIVRVGSWTGAVRWRVLRDWQDERRHTNLLALVAAVSLVDDAGKRLFSDEDIPMLADKHAGALQRIFDTALRLNGLTQERVSGLGKDSSTTTSAVSPSDSPLSSG
jgi:hypothetical protein